MRHVRHGFWKLMHHTFGQHNFGQHMLANVACGAAWNVPKITIFSYFYGTSRRICWPKRSTCVDQSCVDQKYDASAFKNRVERVSIIPRSFYNFLQRNNVFSGQSSAENRPMSTFSVIFSTMRSRGVLSISATKRYHISPPNPKYSTCNRSSFIPRQGPL